MEYSNEEYQVYLKVQHALLLEDAINFVAMYIADMRGVASFDVDDDEIEKYDLEYLVSEYERRQDCNVSFNDTWESVVEDYMEDFEEEEA